MTTKTNKKPQAGIGSDALLNGRAVATLTIEEQDVIEARLVVSMHEKGWAWWFWDDNSGLRLPEAAGRAISEEEAKRAARTALTKAIRDRAENLEAIADRIDDGDTEIEWT